MHRSAERLTTVNRPLRAMVASFDLNWGSTGGRDPRWRWRDAAYDDHVPFSQRI